ncbi:AraC family transcriptional regulator [Ensifer adhaerens]|uniref:helix-turn-helix transcriptional regulator n=1 Tax=Ensifer adhaerens TaxID=106592 RepID=UPI001CBA8BDE|nr:AraC family transcriptional regulator [Ensifer adhaerens]MBZ7922229.1 AraC family transcriptional regulator [Ensifer adhaerens]UAX90875.1 AraC family transcriptional regulator [Ensifer adhaerens]UAX98504.1 AraC family transcriptional regulator [Ensifer adhaerens]UAY05885.1 AraC family transcriptional regulator [Ensifer adhaerens]
MTLSAIQTPQVLLTSAGRAWRGLAADFIHIPRGRVDVPGGEMHRLGMHFGPPVNADCRCGGRRMRRVQKPGDIDIVPAGVDGSWEDDADCRILRLSFSRSLLDGVAADLGRGSVELLPQMQVRDIRLEAIGWAIKADLEAETPSDPLYVDLLANALAVRLIETATGGAQQAEGCSAPKLSARQLRVLTEYIETHLDGRLHLADLAAVAGLSATRLKVLFRNSTGLPVHQYVIRRRVEFARALMTTTAMPASEIAVAAGFSHQSHMASTMRRLLGETPGTIMRRSSEI